MVALGALDKLQGGSSTWLLWLSAGLPPFLCAAAMKKRAPGSQVMAQTVWMLSLQNPKLGACKFAPVLVGMGGSSSGEFWGLAGTWLLLSLDMMGAGSAGWCRAGREAAKAGVVVLGGICLVLGVTRSQGLQLGCVLLPPPNTGRLGFHILPGEVLLPHSPYLLSLQFWAVVSGQQQRPSHIQLLGNLGDHRLAGHAAGARGREPGRVQLPRQSRGTTLTPQQQEQALALQQNFLDPLLPVASRAARQPWHSPVL